jgi:HSP20 family protein
MQYGHYGRHERAHWQGCGAWKQAAQQHGFGRFGRHFAGRWSGSVPVNIRETADYYELSVFAPGLTKDAFNISVTDDVLIVSSAAGHEPNEQPNWLHHEYKRGGFERRFQLNNKVDTDSITARYTDGVLELTLPKVPGAPAQQIAVA